MKKQKGFTLIELLIVIGIIAILAAAVIVAINPGQQFEQARNAARRSQLSSVASAVYSWSVENGGRFPDCVTGITTDTATYHVEHGVGEFWYDLNDTAADCEGSTGGGLVGIMTTDYMNQFPEPPATGETFLIRETNGTLQLTSDSTEFTDVIVQ